MSLVRASLLAAVVLSLACSREPPPPAPVAPIEVAAEHDPVDDAIQTVRSILARGEDAKAIFAFDEVIATLPEGARRSAVRCELAVLLNNRAPRVFPEDPRSADVDSRRALELCPGDDVMKANRARMLVARAAAEPRAEHEARVRALAWLEESVALADDADAHVLLGELRFAEDDVTAAVGHLRKAAALRPKDARLVARLADLEKKAAVEGSFRDNRREHFVARFEGDAHEQLSWTALDQLEKAYFVVGAKLNLYPKEPVTVVIYTGEQYRQVTDVPDWAAGSFDGKIRVREGSLALRQGALESLLRHEYTHAAIATLPTRIPTWMNEGLAQHFEGEDVARLRTFLRRAKAEGALLPFDMLQDTFVAIADPARAQIAYATATVMVRHLVDKRGEYALQTLMSRLAGGEDFDDAFAATYVASPGKVYEDVVDAL